MVEIGGTGGDLHDQDAAIVIELGGNDFYRGRTAAGLDGGVSVVIDLSGDDIYTGEDVTQGAGFWGIGVLLDCAGDDLYRAGRHAQGSGVFGLGLLVDRAGNDLYTAAGDAQASAAWGWGGLIDSRGDDVYRVGTRGQAFAAAGGTAVLCDLSGDDRYLAGFEAPDPREAGVNQSLAQGFAMGLRDRSAGGFALLADGAGNDLYACEYFGQGASYWMGVGVLYDEAGRDAYVARRYAQGAGIHFSLGLLLDAAGDDHTASWGVSQGCGHDFGIGLLLNESGDDTYTSRWLSMGASEANGSGIFVDNGGDDGYGPAGAMPVGGLFAPRRAGGVGLFVDAGGKDRYAAGKARNDAGWGKTRWAVGVDQETGGRSGISLLQPEDPPRERAGPAGPARGGGKDAPSAPSHPDPHACPETARRLFFRSAAWGPDPAPADRAREALLDLDPACSLPVLLAEMETADTLGQEVLDQAFRVHAFTARPLLIRKAGGPGSSQERERALSFLGRQKDARSVDAFFSALDDPDGRVRRAAVCAIGDTLDQDRRQALQSMAAALGRLPPTAGAGAAWEPALADPEVRSRWLSLLVRAVPLSHGAYRVLSRPQRAGDGPPRTDPMTLVVRKNREALRTALAGWLAALDRAGEAAGRIRPLAADPDPEVRRAALYSLAQLLDPQAVPLLLDGLGDRRLWVRDSSVLALALYGESAVPLIREALAGAPPAVRIHALEALSGIGGDPALSLMRRCAGEDPDPAVRRRAQALLEGMK